MKKLICLVLIFVLMLTACSKWEIEIVDPEERGENLSDILSEPPAEEEFIELPYVTDDMLS